MIVFQCSLRSFFPSTHTDAQTPHTVLPTKQSALDDAYSFWHFRVHLCYVKYVLPSKGDWPNTFYPGNIFLLALVWGESAISMFIFDPENIFLSALLVLNITWGEEQTGRYVKAQGLSKLWQTSRAALRNAWVSIWLKNYVKLYQRVLQKAGSKKKEKSLCWCNAVTWQWHTNDEISEFVHIKILVEWLNTRNDGKWKSYWMI